MREANSLSRLGLGAKPVKEEINELYPNVICYLKSNLYKMCTSHCANLVDTTVVIDDRYLLIPLMQAERAWGHAMQLRQEANTEPRKRFHLVQRLRKATVYALQLQKLCEVSIIVQKRQ